MVNKKSDTPNTNDLSQLRNTYEKFKMGDLELKGENIIDRNGNVYNASFSDNSNPQESQESEFYEDTLGANPESASPSIKKPFQENNITKQNDFAEAPKVKRSRPDSQPISKNAVINQVPTQLTIPRDNIQIESQECDMDMESDDEFTSAPALNHPPSRPAMYTNPPEPLKENKSTDNSANQGLKPNKYVLALLNRQRNNNQPASETQNSVKNANTHTSFNEVSKNSSIRPPEPKRTRLSSAEPTRVHVPQPEHTGASLPPREPTTVLAPESARATLPQPETTRSCVPPSGDTGAPSLLAQSTRSHLSQPEPIRAPVPPAEPPIRAYVSPPEPTRTYVPPPSAITSRAPQTSNIHAPLINGTDAQPAPIDLSSLLQATQSSSQPINALNSSTSTIQSLFNSAPQVPAAPMIMNQNGQYRVIFVPYIDLDRLRTNLNNPNQQ